jgi:hypothetical protein
VQCVAPSVFGTAGELAAVGELAATTLATFTEKPNEALAVYYTSMIRAGELRLEPAAHWQLLSVA